MTRLTAGGTPEAVATATTDKTRLVGSNADIRYAVVVPGATFRVFRAATGDNQITDMLDAAGTAIAVVTADDFGNLPAFQLPDGLRLDVVWLDPDDSSTTRFPVPVRFGPASADAAYASWDGTNLKQNGQVIPVGGSGDVTLTANPDGLTYSLTSASGSGLAANTDGLTYTLTA